MLFAAVHESAFGPKQTSQVAPHVSAFGGKADLTVCRCPLSRSLLGVKRTSHVAPHMSANGPKRTCAWALGPTCTPTNNYTNITPNGRNPHTWRSITMRKGIRRRDLLLRGTSFLTAGCAFWTGFFQFG